MRRRLAPPPLALAEVRELALALRLELLERHAEVARRPVAEEVAPSPARDVAGVFAELPAVNPDLPREAPGDAAPVRRSGEDRPAVIVGRRAGEERVAVADRVE